jgi:hypothetical protein
LLAFKDGELLAKGEVFEHQTAACPKSAKHGSEPEPKQVKHGNKVIADPLAGCPTKLLISRPDRIVTRHTEPKQVKHGNQVIADRLCRLLCEVVDFTAGQDCDEGQG